MREIIIIDADQSQQVRKMLEKAHINYKGLSRTKKNSRHFC